MKKLLLSICAIFALGLVSCGEDKPVVTYEETVSSNVYYPNFGASSKKILYDANRLCDDGYTFRVTKSNNIIASSDVCDHCGHCWYTHDKE